MDPYHRKVDLQSPADLVYLHNNIKSGAQQKLDLAIPPQGEDAFRTKVQDLVQEYITQTLHLALPSIALNGLDPSPTLLFPPPEPASPSENDTNYEPYDSRLAARLRELYASLEYESTRVAELRRDAPGAAARAYMEKLEVEMAAEREIGERDREEEEGGVELEGGSVERIGEVRRMWERGREGLVRLENVTEALAKVERAEKAAEAVRQM